MLARLANAVLACVGLSGCVYYLNPLCTDQISNGDETDVDCGGSCGRCNLGASCRADADCDEGECVGGTCTPFPCDNGVLDDLETDVDCGGGTCRKCSGDRHCQADTDCFSGTCEPGTGTCSAIQLSFTDAIPYPSGDKTYALFSDDLDGDGDLDLAAANEQDSSVTVFLNDGAAVFERVGPAVPTGEYPTGGTIRDFNHDGIPDVITADYHGDSVSILLGIGTTRGTGMLAPKASYDTEDGAETSNLAVGDLNGDGNLDVVATNPSTLKQTPSISVFLGRSDGTLGTAVNSQVGNPGGSRPFSAAIEDFDGNGTQDVAIGDIQNGPVIVKLGNGDGTFQAETLYPSGGLGPNILITGDLNLDGKRDLISANRGADSVSVFLGRGDGTFRKAIVSPVGEVINPVPAKIGPYSAAVADFNLDGVPDVVTANFLAGNATVLLGIGDGRFEKAFDAGATGVFAYGVIAGDLNADGKPDLATCNAVDDNVTVKLSTAQ